MSDIELMYNEENNIIGFYSVEEQELFYRGLAGDNGDTDGDMPPVPPNDKNKIDDEIPW
ncbi:MAG: hypothetical protein WBB28_14625 [Crinalium sp.]